MSDDSSGEEDFPPKKAAKRTSRVPNHLLLDYVEVSQSEKGCNDTVLLKCSQTGDKFSTKLSNLSDESGDSISISDAQPGLKVLANVEGGALPAEIITIDDGSKKARTTRAKNRKAGCTSSSSKKGILEAAATKKPRIEEQSDKVFVISDQNSQNGRSIQFTEGDRDLIIRIDKKVDAILSSLKGKQKFDSGNSEIKQEEQSHYVINGMNLKMIPARDAYAYALSLMDVMFTPAEMSVSLLFSSKRSLKPALDPAKVEKLLDLVDLRYKDNYDLKTLRQKCNQKCQDSKKLVSGAPTTAEDSNKSE